MFDQGKFSDMAEDISVIKTPDSVYKHPKMRKYKLLGGCEDDKLKSDWRKKTWMLLMYTSIVICVMYTVLFYGTLWDQAMLEHQKAATENELINLADTAVLKIDDVLNTLDVSLSDLESENRRLASDYLNAVGAKFRNESKEIIQNVKTIINKTEEDTKRNRGDFESAVAAALDGILDYYEDDIKAGVEAVEAATDTSTVEKTIKDAISKVEKALSDAFNDIYSMYSFYADYAPEFIQKKATEGIRKINIYCKSKIKADIFSGDRVQMCYRIDRQNEKVVEKLNSLLGVTNVAIGCRSALDSALAVSPSSDVLHDLQVSISEKFFRSVDELKNVLYSDSLYLGSKINESSVDLQATIREKLLSNLKKAVSNFPSVVKTTMDDYTLVTMDHYKSANDRIQKVLYNVTSTVVAKSHILQDTELIKQLREKAAFGYVESWVDDKFKMFAQLLNPLTEIKKSSLSESVQDEVKFATRYMFPVVYVARVETYAPEDECPKSVAFQIRAQETMRDLIRSSCGTESDTNSVEEYTYVSPPPVSYRAMLMEPEE